ncbi:MAG TPA: SRPBCC domain-containing protein [Planctomycetia bacterium]|nr:SRPBCC domain-containing protein [Planctomycetia bacterium]
MIAEAAGEGISILNITKEIEIAAPVEIAWAATLAELGPENEMPDGTKFQMVFEAWPGGRWFRDLGNGAGHLWGHVQVIKPTTLIEIRGPLFMSYPAVNFMQYRFAPEGAGTKLKLLHRAMGLIPEEHKTGVHAGWTHWMERIRMLAETRYGTR